MAIMQSCCCWRSVRHGSFACAVYSVFYYSALTVTIATVLQDESQYLAGNHSRPKSNSVLEPEVSPTTIRFNIAFLVCSACGVICCLLLLYGLFKDEKVYLLPWIVAVILCIAVDISHLVYLFFFVTLALNPIRAMLLTFDFFLQCLNAYSVLCVVSQYQEYAAGRGTASDDCQARVPAVRYNVQPTPTGTSCLSSRRAATTNNDVTRQTTATPSQSPTTTPLLLLTAESRSPMSRKHVQFPDAASSAAPPITADKITSDEAIPPRLKTRCNMTEMDCLLVPAKHHSSRTTSTTKLMVSSDA
ncbi:uncharacterized protein LOC106647128 [Copidosoma floridanum]|uniref:uncharacterized protein LOC106647128 n=1 Tax=Copidosoma floridanum TaxID=29053 RepID=UPI0006C9BB97|nr:uncharacterized protein LOC106647128 [Copidosoma floridanum]